MKIQLLIATSDKDYANHLSGVLSENHAESFEVTVCSAASRLENLLSTRTFDVALLESALIPPAGLSGVRLPLLLWDESEPGNGGVGDYEKIRKYQRISRISSDILEGYSKTAVGIAGFGGSKARISAVWSPSGGVGKTTVALAYAAQKAVGGGKITYLDLEYFSSASVYFSESGKSISTAFERLGGNVALLLQAIVLKDSGSGISYFSPPNNYDDMNELTAEDIEALVAAVSDNSDELVIDLPSVCDERRRKVLEAADVVYLVTDGSRTATSKLQQFVTQHNLFEQIRMKLVLVANKGAKVNDTRFNRTVYLPQVSASDPVSVYKTLSGVSFE
jgi:cellulose biosynthesis protein BcsQ